jgi:hypothetical protein
LKELLQDGFLNMNINELGRLVEIPKTIFQKNRNCLDLIFGELFSHIKDNKDYGFSKLNEKVI